VTKMDIALANMLAHLKGKKNRQPDNIRIKTSIRMIEQHLNCYESKRGEGYGEARRAAI
jgi:hypothetical protein